MSGLSPSIPENVTPSPDSTYAILANIAAVSVNGEVLSLAEILCQAFQRHDVEFLDKAIRQTLMMARARAEDITVQPDELARMWTIFRQGQGLDTDEALSDWLDAGGLSCEQLEAQLISVLTVGKLKRKIIDPQIEAYFHAHRQQFDRLVVVRLASVRAALAQPLVAALRAGASLTDLGQHLAQAEGSPLEMQLLAHVYPIDVPTSVAQLKPGDVLGPRLHQERWELFRLETRRPAQLDRQTHSRIHHLLFAQWLAAEQQQADINRPLQEGLL
ncbi:MAG: hypothetical protein ETSY1_46330 (plasmid) [Candidatus Entotheonella factor]|uniref:PpiC domain-containing protein n=1 Tax=Entotheonella factor TaxID=1429438 RepID=W4M045_ENTF1|nr:MAG: hypothetical protein ETSY1_46330 [Candidatus Entotheonella factor]